MFDTNRDLKIEVILSNVSYCYKFLIYQIRLSLSRIDYRDYLKNFDTTHVMAVVQTWNRCKPVAAIWTGSTYLVVNVNFFFYIYLKTLEFWQHYKEFLFWLIFDCPNYVVHTHGLREWVNEWVSGRITVKNQLKTKKSRLCRSNPRTPRQTRYDISIVMWFFSSIRFIIIILLSLQQNQLSTASKSILFAAAGGNLPFLSSFLPSCFRRMHRSGLQVVNLPVLIQFSI